MAALEAAYVAALEAAYVAALSCSCGCPRKNIVSLNWLPFYNWGHSVCLGILEFSYRFRILQNYSSRAVGYIIYIL